MLLGLICARGGSKGLPGKNIKPLNGLPLIAYSIKAALESGVVDKLIVSTDSKEIADVAMQYGAEVPFMRPDELATDTALSADVVYHAMTYIEQNETQYDRLLLLQPTSPLRKPEDIRNAVKLFNEKQCKSVIGVSKACQHPSSFFQLKNREIIEYDKVKKMANVNRQELEDFYKINGAIYLVDWSYFKQSKSFYSENTIAYIMASEKSIDIDDINDFEYAEFLLKRSGNRI